MSFPGNGQRNVGVTGHPGLIEPRFLADTRNDTLSARSSAVGRERAAKRGIEGLVWSEQNAEALTRPRVRTFFSTRTHEPLRPEIIDLAVDGRDQIESPEPPDKWKFAYANDLWIGTR